MITEKQYFDTLGLLALAEMINADCDCDICQPQPLIDKPSFSEGTDFAQPNPDDRLDSHFSSTEEFDEVPEKPLWKVLEEFWNPDPNPPYQSVGREAADLVIDGERRHTYGDAKESTERIAKFWNVYLSDRLDESTAPLDAEDVAMMMVLMKVSRQMWSDHRDNLVDICGYAELANLILDEERDS